MSKKIIEVYVHAGEKDYNGKYQYEITTISNIDAFKVNYAIVRRRYSQFLKLHDKIRKTEKELPMFPKKTIMKCGKNDALKRERMFACYMRFVGDIMVDRDNDWDNEVVKFLSESEY